MWKLFILSLLISTNYVMANVVPASVEEVCGDLFSSFDRRDCYDLASRAYTSPLALGICNDVFQSSKLDCVKAIAGKRYSRQDVYRCDNEWSDFSKVRCLENSGIPTRVGDIPQTTTREVRVNYEPNMRCIRSIRPNQGINDIVSGKLIGGLLGDAARCDDRRIAQAQRGPGRGRGRGGMRGDQPLSNCTFVRYEREVPGCLQEMFTKANYDFTDRSSKTRRRVSRLQDMCSVKVMSCTVTSTVY